MFTIILCVALLVALTPWTIFPLALRLLPRRRPQRGAARIERVSILIPAHNEAARIRAKVENARLLAAELGVPVEILVGADGCTDATAALAEDAGAGAIFVHVEPERRGKAATLNALAGMATGDVLLMTDASTSLGTRDVARLLDALQDPTIGAATARYKVNELGRAWDVDAVLRGWASERGVLCGGSGAALAVRAAAFEPLPADTINDDYVIPLRLARRGLGIAYVRDAIVLDTPTRRARTTFERHARIAAGNVQMIARAGRGLFQPGIAIPLLLHKAPKVMLPWLLVATGGAALTDDALRPLVIAMLAVVAGFAVVAGQRFTTPVLALLGVAAGTVRAVVGQDVRWRRPDDEPEENTMHPEERTAYYTYPALEPIPASVRAGKRLIDIIGAALGLVVLAPVIGILAVLVKLGSRGPAFYGQERVRCDDDGSETTFIMWKLRTMRLDAETSSGPVWAQQDDPRVTPVGRFLRKARLDELPQLWNVLRGEMSLVGPRPERPRFVSWLDGVIPGYSERVRRVRPGITGWAQVHCPYDTSVDDVRQKVLFDLAYVAHMYSFTSFLRIEVRTILATFSVMMFGRGAR